LAAKTMIARQIKAVFVAPGAALGELRDERLLPFPWTFQLLTILRSVLNLRVGVIANLPAELTAMQLKQFLVGANLLRFLDPYGFVTNVDAKALKPDPRIYVYAAEQMVLNPAQCLYIAEDSADTEGACAAGMAAILRDHLLTADPAIGSGRREKSSVSFRLY